MVSSQCNIFHMFFYHAIKFFGAKLNLFLNIVNNSDYNSF